MKRYSVTLGALTTAGGKVIFASSNGSINGVAIALENDPISCPACKSQGHILCVGPRLPETWNGKPIALEKDLCICGCSPSPRLIANQSLRYQLIANDDACVSTLATATSPQASIVPTGMPTDSNYDLEFTVTDERSGFPLAEWPYTIELTNGSSVEGRTTAAGKTAKVTAPQAEHAILRIYVPDSAPINPNWDR